MHVRQKWRIQGLYPAKILFLIYRIFGHWLQSNFAVRHSVSNGEEFQLGGFSDRGIANDIYIVRPDEPSYKRLLKKLLLTLIVRPVAQRESHQKHFDWYWSGQRAQFQTLRDIYQMEYDDFWQEVLCPNIHFIMEWSGIPHDQYGTLIEFYEDTLLLPNKVDFLKKWKEQLNQWMTESAFRIFISFFYQHGN